MSLKVLQVLQHIIHSRTESYLCLVNIARPEAIETFSGFGVCIPHCKLIMSPSDHGSEDYHMTTTVNPGKLE